MPSVFNETRPRARSRHRCCECRGWIERGERYVYSWGIWEGSAASYKTCLGCDALRTAVSKLTHCCVPFTALHEEIFELRSESEEPCPSLARMDAIRIQRGASICPLYHAEENDLSHLLA